MPTGLVDSMTIPSSTTLPVRVFSELALSFATPEGAPLEITARVLAGGTTEVVVALENPELLEMGEVVRGLSLDGDRGCRSVFTDADGGLMASTTFTIEARHDADPPEGMVLASGRVVSGEGRVAYTRVVSTTLSVEIAPRHFRLSLSYRSFSRTERPNKEIPDGTDMQSVRSIITVEDEITIESLAVRVEIRHSHIGDLRVFLVSPEGAMVALHDEEGSSADNIFETYTSLDHAGLAALVGESAQGEWTLTVGDYNLADIGTLEAWSLEISEFPGGGGGAGRRQRGGDGFAGGGRNPARDAAAVCGRDAGSGADICRHRRCAVQAEGDVRRGE